VTQTQQEIMAMLARKSYTTGQGHGDAMTNYYTTSERGELDRRWLIDAVELLLRIELERQG
jgi:hypothetical protein